MPHAAHKSTLLKYIRKIAPHSPSVPSSNVQYVLDGGALLHRISQWPDGATYRDMITLYTAFVIRHYGASACIVFDGYHSSRPTTKHITHLRRNSKQTAYRNVNIEPSYKVHTTSASSFLGTSQNKSQFISFLKEHMTASGLEVHQAEGDADWQIVSCTLQKATTRPCILIGDDTDLLVMLLYHTKPSHHPIFMQTSAKIDNVFDIHQLQSNLGQSLCANILFAHAFTGCDTTSRIYGIGKAAVLKNLGNNLVSREAEVFRRSDATQEEVAQAGECVFTLLLGGKPEHGLKRLRYTKYMTKVIKNKVAVEAHGLPPTAAASRFHSLRVYYQCREWCGEAKDPEDWGWKINEKSIQPIYTNAPPAPANILKFVRCSCVAGCKARCSCRKHGLTCSSSCGCSSCCTNCQADAEA